jgi:hypothetical protein
LPTTHTNGRTLLRKKAGFNDLRESPNKETNAESMKCRKTAKKLNELADGPGHAFSAMPKLAISRFDSFHQRKNSQINQIARHPNMKEHQNL